MAYGNEWRPKVNPWIIAATMILPTFMVTLDTSVANVALPYIAGSLSVSPDEATWVLTVYLVANAIVLPITGWVSHAMGRRRFLISSIIAFTISSVLSGAAVSMNMILAARAIQGATGGALLPLSQAILLESFPAGRRGEAMAIFTVGVIVAPVLGPVLGGWITDSYSWRWVFYINMPICLLATFLTILFIEDPPYTRAHAPKSVDYFGFTLMAIGLGALQIVLDRGQVDDWFSNSWILTGALISGICLIGFIVRELCTDEPIVNLRVLTDRNFAVGVVMVAVYGCILYGSLIRLPLLLEDLMGYTALKSGLATSPRGLGALISTTITGWLLRKIDGRILIVIGFFILSMAHFLLGDINLQVSVYDIVVPNFIMGYATGMIFVPITTIAVGMLPNEMIGTATGLYNLMRTMGGSIGIATVDTLLIRGAQLHQAMMVHNFTAYNPAFQKMLHELTIIFGTRNDPVTAIRKAYQALYNILLSQSSMLSFIDNFRLFGYLCLVSIPMTLFFKGGTKAARQQAHISE